MAAFIAKQMIGSKLDSVKGKFESFNRQIINVVNRTYVNKCFCILL